MSYYNAFNEISKASDYIFKVLNRPSAHIFQDITVLNIKNTSEFLQHLNRFDCQGQILDRSGRDSDKPGLDLDRPGLWKTNRDTA